MHPLTNRKWLWL